MIANRKSVSTVAVFKRGNSVVREKPLADMSEKELKEILTLPGRVTSYLVNDVHRELHTRKFNADLKTARQDAELHQEILEALIAEGRAPHVARALIDTEAKMIVQGKRLDII